MIASISMRGAVQTLQLSMIAVSLAGAGLSMTVPIRGRAETQIRTSVNAALSASYQSATNNVLSDVVSHASEHRMSITKRGYRTPDRFYPTALTSVSLLLAGVASAALAFVPSLAIYAKPIGGALLSLGCFIGASAAEMAQRRGER